MLQKLIWQATYNNKSSLNMSKIRNEKAMWAYDIWVHVSFFQANSPKKSSRGDSIDE